MRLPLQRQRLLQAAAFEFAERGYAGASSESISKRAGMSKATFYEHFANKEECILALFDRAAEVVAGGRWRKPPRGAGRDAAARDARGDARAFLALAVAEHPEFAQTLLVEIIGAGPRGRSRRDQDRCRRSPTLLDAENARRRAAAA